MTQEDILEMARSSGVTDGIELQHEIDAVMRFAELVAAAERKAFAKVCIKILEEYKIPCGNSSAGELAADWTLDALENIRESIRARGDL